MRRMDQWGVFVVGCWLGAAGCGSPSGGADAAGGGSAGAEEPLDDVVPDVSEVAPHLELVSSGEEPRVDLRYNVPVGQEEAMRLALALQAEVRSGAEAAVVAAPPMALDLRVGPIETFADGRIRYRMQASNATFAYPPDAPPEVVAQIEREMAPLAAITGSVVVDPRGVTQSTSFALPENLAPRQRTMLGNIRATLMSIPFPSVPVGRGAVWKVRRGLRIGPVQVMQEARYTLTDLAGTRGRVQIAFTQTAPVQVLGEVEPGVVATLEAYESSGAGSAGFDLGRIVPQAEADVTSTLRARLDGPQGAGLMQQRTRLVVQLGPLQ